ncbi:hypothetical protein SEA_FLAGSTAFF_25 [Mycobacterium phage FlagStaff]|uniref:Uncharacterized protein n=1 Tax=Mycobacterium phage FlagStaff TaxID=1647304 RepID=A0A0F6SJM2_9CAUD|nr:hypothetical protein AVT49_gp25 [Mycobacterium phage FlagStaff]AKF14462.1 hypothetical protein SEA_FLAGSTAFF_25 [Mycobacterium phage FlagStaff]
MTTTEPVNIVWGVQWEVFVMPESFASSLPVAPAPMSDEPTDEEREAWQTYLEANAAFEAEMITLTGDEDNWSPTVAVMDEEQARNSLPMLRDANQGNPFNRNFQLVQAVEPVWTVVEA